MLIMNNVILDVNVARHAAVVLIAMAPWLSPLFVTVAELLMVVKKSYLGEESPRCYDLCECYALQFG